MNLFEDGDLTTPAIVNQEVALMLGDRTSFWGAHPVLQAGYLGDFAKSGSDTRTRRESSTGLGVMTAKTEVEATTPTDFDFAAISASIGRRSFARSTSQMLQSLDRHGVVRDPVAFAQDAVQIMNNTIAQMIVDVAVTHTQSVAPFAANTDPLDWETIYDAEGLFTDANVPVVPGQMLFICTPKQWRQLRKQYRDGGMGGSHDDSFEAYKSQMIAGSGFQGNYWGVDILTSNRVPAVGGVSQGVLLTPGSIGWGYASQDADSTGGGQVLLAGGMLELFKERDGSTHSKNVYYNAFFGAAKGNDQRGIRVLSGE